MMGWWRDGAPRSNTLTLQHPNSPSALWPCEYMAQIQIHDRRIKQQTVQQVEYSADARKIVARVLKSGLAFEERLDQIADHRRRAQQNPENHGVLPVHAGEPVSGEMREKHARQRGQRHRPGE